MARRTTSAAVAFAAVLLASCETSSPSSSANTFANPTKREGEDVVSVNVSASNGGNVELPGGPRLEIPPGALAADTTITLRVVKALKHNELYVFEPAGLTFSKPAILHVPLRKDASGRVPLFEAFESSASTPAFPSGRQLTNWNDAEVLGFDEVSSTAQISVPHFTFYYVAKTVDAPGYVVIDVPDKYLEAGDMVYTLTGSKGPPTWRPGHVGVLRQIIPETNHAFLMESTPPNGVDVNDLARFKVESGHLYLGVRRPKGAPLTEQQRATIVAFVNGLVGRSYLVIGEGNTDVNSFSCVGLAEAAYDNVNRGMAGAVAEATALTPREVFHETVPVNEIWTRVDEDIDVPIYGVTIDSGSPIFGRAYRGWYQRRANYTIAAGDLPEGATLEGTPDSGYHFRWKPKVEQTCESTKTTSACPNTTTHAKDYTIKLKMHVTPFGTALGARVALDPFDVEETLVVHVSGHTRVFDIEPANPYSKRTYNLFLEVPEKHTVHRRLVRDEETKAEVTTGVAPFPNHTLTITNESCSSGGCSLSVELRNDGAETIAAPPKKLRYTIDFVRDLYRGF